MGHGIRLQDGSCASRILNPESCNCGRPNCGTAGALGVLRNRKIVHTGSVHLRHPTHCGTTQIGRIIQLQDSTCVSAESEYPQLGQSSLKSAQNHGQRCRIYLQPMPIRSDEPARINIMQVDRRTRVWASCSLFGAVLGSKWLKPTKQWP